MSQILKNQQIDGPPSSQSKSRSQLENDIEDQKKHLRDE